MLLATRNVPLGTRPESANCILRANPNRFRGLSVPNSTSGGGDGLNSASYTFAGNDPVKHDTLYFQAGLQNPRLTEAIRLFIRGNLQNDHSSTPPQFPGLPPNDFKTEQQQGNRGGLHVRLLATI